MQECAKSTFHIELLRQVVETVLVWLPPQDVLGSFCVGGRVVRENSLERRPSVPIWTLSICTLFVRSEAGMMD